MKSILLSLIFVFCALPNNKQDTTYKHEYLKLEVIPYSKIYDTSVLFIKSQESIRLKPYRCSGSKWTIGWGHVMTKKEKKLYRKGITLEQADSLFSKDYSKVIKATKRNFPELTSYKKFIITSMISYNIGTSFSHHRLGKAIKADEDIKPYLLKYKFSKGKILRGLVKRRKAELKLWNASQEEFISYADSYKKIIEKDLKKFL